MAAASENDFRDITDQLGPDELHHLFYNLGISKRDVEHAEKSADTTDTRLKAIAVLIRWRKMKGRDATLEALLEAKRKLGNRKGIHTTVNLSRSIYVFANNTVYNNNNQKVALN